MSKASSQGLRTWRDSTPQETVQQVIDLCRQALFLSLEKHFDGVSFTLGRKKGNPPEGILSVTGWLIDEEIIRVWLELFKGPKTSRVPSSPFIEHLSSLGEMVRLAPPQKIDDDQVVLAVELKVKASPMSLARADTFVSELKKLDALARSLKAEVPVAPAGLDLAKLYEKLKDSLYPVYPLNPDWIKGDPHLLHWARETIDILSGSFSTALASPCGGTLRMGLAALSLVALALGRSLGHIVPPAVTARDVISAVEKAPGWIVVPVSRINLGTNVYELKNEMRNLLVTLTEMNRPVIFTGRYEELQSVFHGGQGGENDPLYPVLRHMPDTSLESLIRFSLQWAALETGGLSPAEEDRFLQEIRPALETLDPSGQRRILPALINRFFPAGVWRKSENVLSPKEYASLIGGLSETLGGLSPRPRSCRSTEVQSRFTCILANPDLLPYFQDRLLGQEEALEQLVSRLSMESLTRPPNQPIRYCAQGGPATGKSESAVLLARRLNIPHLNIDAASIPDYYTAAAQLLGSGRGIVGSHQSGRLEQAAKHHTGAVLEISDLDHASPQVRSALADLFLQVLETGEAQSATGSMFSCANIIFAFTMNLPGCLDETVRKGIGFSGRPSGKEVGQRVAVEIRRMLSAAFLSRVGTPILFQPLTDRALADIVERAIEIAIISACERLGCPVEAVILEEGLGAAVVSRLEAKTATFGARLLLEQGRSLAARALVGLRGKGELQAGVRLRVSLENTGELRIEEI